MSPERTSEPAMLPIFGHPEDLADLRRAELDLLVLGLEHALERGLDVLDRGVDDRVVPDVDVLAVGQVAGVALGPDVEAEDDGVGGRGQRDVVLGDRADAAVDDPQRDLGVDLDLEQGVLDRLDGTADVALEDEVELGVLTLLEAVEQRLEGRPATALRQRGVALPGRAALGDLAGDAVLVDDEEVVAGAGDPGEAEDLHGLARARLGDVLAALVEHGADAAEGVTGDDRVADPQRPRWTRTVATGPRPLSRRASMATPCALTLASASSSSAASVVSRMASRSSSRPLPFLADTSTNIVVPPYSSATRPYSVS
jgi:hypothetical protein